MAPKIKCVTQTITSRAASPWQKRYFTFWQHHPESYCYDNIALFTITGQLNRDALQDALGLYIKHHHPWLNSYFYHNTTALQQQQLQAPLHYREITRPHPPSPAEIPKLSPAINLSCGPLYDFVLIKHTSNSHTLLAHMAHIESDAITGAQFFTLVKKLYAAITENHPLPEPLAFIEQAPILTSDVPAGVNFWKSQLAGHALKIPFQQTGLNRSIITKTCKPLPAQKITQHCHQYRITPLMLLSIALAKALATYSKINFIPMTYSINLRTTKTQAQPGCYINRIPQPIDTSGNPIESTRTLRHLSKPYRHLPYQHLLAGLNTKDPTQAFNISITESLADKANWQLANTDWQAVWLPIAPVSTIRLVYAFSKALAVRLEFDRQYISNSEAQTITQLFMQSLDDLMLVNH